LVDHPANPALPDDKTVLRDDNATLRDADAAS
jgi:hypothetical protein